LCYNPLAQLKELLAADATALTEQFKFRSQLIGGRKQEVPNKMKKLFG